MGARRKLGEYTMIIKWQPNNRGFTPWVVGGYDWSMRRAGKNRGGDSGHFIIWDQPSQAAAHGLNKRSNEHGATPEDLGVSRDKMNSPRAYDAVMLRVIEQLREYRPNDRHLQEMQAHAYVIALRGGLIDNDDLARAPEHTQMRVDEILRENQGGLY